MRVANIHVGRLETTSPAESVWQALTSFKTAHTVGWYIYSAWFFGEVYIWSRDTSANLGWVETYERAYEKPRLNENPIFLRSFYLCLAVAQAGLHLGRDYDRIAMPEEAEGLNKQNGAQQPWQQQEVVSKVPNSLQELYERLPTLVGRVLRLAIPGFAFALPAYFLFFRRLFWPYFYAIGRTFFRDLPQSSQPTGLGLGMQLMWQAATSSAMLILLWELSNAVFTIFVSQSPLKREQPLTSEIKDAQGNVISKSKDPNGSLLSGLKSKKEVPKSFALWELWLICSQFETRRKTIYTEVDRRLVPGMSRDEGSTWFQISKTCLNEISAIKIHIATALAPTEHAASTAEMDLQRRQQEHLIAQEPQGSLSMPKIADRKVEDNRDVLAKSRPNFAHSVGNIAKSIGQSPNAPNPVVPRARRAIEWGADRVLSKDEQARLSREGLTKEANSTFVRILKTPLGEPFRQTFARRVRAVVFGMPYSSSTNIVHASRSLAQLAVCSLKEDDYGQVAKSVPTIIRTYTSTITEIEKFVAQGLAPSWTDVWFRERDRKEVEEVNAVLSVLKEGLRDVLLAFGEYATGIGVTKVELREAREAVGRG